jgi:hypothetical protein
MDSVICPSCHVERPANEVQLVDKDKNYYQCRICIMLNRPCVPGIPKTQQQLDDEKAAKERARAKVAEPKVPKKEPTAATCPGCLKSKRIEDFKGANSLVYRFCNQCRENETKLGDERAKRLLGGGIFSGVSMTLGRCINCGHIGEIQKDFPVDVSQPTGYKPYCLNKCEGRRR